MKKILTIMLIAALALSMIACTQTPSEPESSSPSSEVVLEEVEDVSSEEQLEADENVDDLLYVADAALYRGEITSMEDGALIVEQVEGRDFGAEQITFTLSESTRYNEDSTSFATSDYIEVYYSPQSYDAIAINKLSPAEDIIFNGSFVEFDEENSTLLLTDLNNTDSQMLFNITEDTSAYLYFDELVVGDKLSVMHSGEILEGDILSSEAIELFKIKE